MKKAEGTSSALSIGRFSTGMEQTGPSAGKDRVGRFSTGMEQNETLEAELEEPVNSA